ncbi:MAG: helix-turn-helix domain-containing protein [Actinomycetota bacterium]|nr:helix-turn-helix domain-containing protein [Actinomycetota bacterium]
MPRSPSLTDAAASTSVHLRARSTSLTEWQEVASRSFVPLSVSTSSPRDFRVDLAGRVHDDVVFSTIVASAHTVAREPALIDSSAEDYLKLTLQVRGTGVLVQDGREATLRPGDIALYDTSRPYTLDFAEDLALVCVMIPHRRIDVPVESLDRLTAVRMEGSQGLPGAVGQFLAGVTSTLARLDPATALRVTHNAMDLVTTLVEHKLGLAERGDSHALLRHRIDTYINANLADPTLSPEKIAAASYISTRYLHAIFHRRGTTVSRWVRERRLEHARRELLVPSSLRRSVAQVAVAWGFVDASHFSKVFRERFGTSPSQYRVEALDSRARSALHSRS